MSGLKRKPLVINRKMTEQDGACFWCETQLIAGLASFDHLLPASQGGTWAKDNLVLTCKDCNGRRGDMHPEAYLRRMHRLCQYPRFPTEYTLQKIEQQKIIICVSQWIAGQINHIRLRYTEQFQKYFLGLLQSRNDLIVVPGDLYAIFKNETHRELVRKKLETYKQTECYVADNMAIITLHPYSLKSHYGYYDKHTLDQRRTREPYRKA